MTITIHPYEDAAHEVLRILPSVGSDDWEPYWSPTTDNQNARDENAERFMQAYLKGVGMTMEENPSPTDIEDDAPVWNAATGRIKMPALNRWNHGAGYYAALLHEVGHSTARGLKRPAGEASLMSGLMMQIIHPLKAKEEMIAEFASVYLAKALGLPVMAHHAAEYTANWIQHAPRDLVPMILKGNTEDGLVAAKFALEKANG